MLTKENKKQWVDALRSGKYGQCRGRLQYRGKYCCLGVWVAVTKDVTMDARGESMINAQGEDVGYDPLFNLLGIHPETETPYVSILWKMNDNEQKSFNEIADYIEQNL